MGQVRDKISPSDHCNENRQSHSDPPLSGRARVRAVLLDPIDAAGAKRHGRATLAEHHAMKERLADTFAHMPDTALEGLRDLIFRHLGGKDGLQWPPEAWLRKSALRLCPKPPRANPYVKTLMASAMGQRAIENGYGAELLSLAIKLGPPPSKYDLAKLARQAQDARREAERIQRLSQDGRALPDDLDWLDSYQRAQILARELSQEKVTP